MASCLGQCGHCSMRRIAMADEVLVTADTTKVLFEGIKNAIGEREVAYDRK